MAPSPKEQHMLLFSDDVVDFDCIVTKIMGFDYKKFKGLYNAVGFYPLTKNKYEQIELKSNVLECNGLLDLINFRSISKPFVAGKGWRGHIELWFIISIDYVFAGSGEDFYEPEDKKAPQNIYGKSKLDGELAVQEILDKYFIVRISWVFGSNGKNFIKTMLNLAKNHDKLTIVNDQIGSPTYTVDLAKLLCDMALSDKYGVYHATNEGICSWYDFACEIFKQAGIKIDVEQYHQHHSNKGYTTT